MQKGEEVVMLDWRGLCELSKKYENQGFYFQITFDRQGFVIRVTVNARKVCPEYLWIESRFKFDRLYRVDDLAEKSIFEVDMEDIEYLIDNIHDEVIEKLKGDNFRKFRRKSI